MKKTRLKLMVAVSSLVVLSICTLPLKKNIDTTINTVQWELDQRESSRNVKVKVKGTYRSYLLRRNSFDGEIQIDGQELAQNATLRTIYFNDGVGELTYQDDQDFMELSNQGFLMCSSDF